jgi:glycosyltransferase involved in cell wall biosynthesis
MQRVSIIVPCYNQAKYLTEALDSVLKQTYPHWECIIVNDGSTDETFKTAEQYCNNDRRFKYVEKENGGLANARNYGIKESEGEFILPLDADDKIGAGYIEEAVEILNKNPEIGIVYCEVEFFGAKTGKWKLPDFSINRILTKNIIPSCAMFRKSDFLKTKGYNPNMIYGWEDWDFWLLLIELGKGVKKIPFTHFYYRIKHNESMLNNLGLSENKMNQSLNTIYFNHIDFYMERIGNPIKLYSKLNRILSSKDYKIGRLIVNPGRKIKKIFKRYLNK